MSYLSTLMAVRFRIDAVQDITSAATHASHNWSLSVHFSTTCRREKATVSRCSDQTEYKNIEIKVLEKKKNSKQTKENTLLLRQIQQVTKHVVLPVC